MSDWWRTAVIYQVYPRSFADADGDGIGDLPGLASRLDYLAELGVDAIWISPFYLSPLNDGGYDVADYRAVDPRLGTLDDIRRVIDGAHERGLRVLMDIVPNHTSSEHRWFQELLAAEPGSPAWSRYVTAQGKADAPPNNWRSIFHGSGWSRLPGEGDWWYLHLFDTTQPDLNWESAEVRAEFEDVLRFWFDLGVDGFRIDVAHGLVKEPGLPDCDYSKADSDDEQPGLLEDVPASPYFDQDGVHAIYRSWRKVADSYEPPRIFCGETWVPNPERLARYQRPDELHTSFNFDYLMAGWDRAKLRSSIDETIANHRKVGAPPTWVLSNHDVVRHRSRLAPGFDRKAKYRGRAMADSLDLHRGLTRARAATLFTAGLPGSLYLYQGEELGLPEVLELDDAVRQDPAFSRSKGTDGFRDGCRVPIPWSGDAPSYGFGPGSASWLPQPESWGAMSAAAEQGVDGSTLELYRRMLRTRRAEGALASDRLVWVQGTDAEVLAFTRPAVNDAPGVHIAMNLANHPIALPASLGTEVLISSGDEVAAVRDGDAREHLVLGPETAVWLRA